MLVTQQVAQQGQVLNPFTVKQADNPGGLVQATYGQMGEQLSSEIRGKYGTAAKRGVLFWANAAAITVPVVGGTVVSLFNLYNPLSSTFDLELVDSTFASVVATTVVDAIGLYVATPAQWAALTASTQGTVKSGMVGGPSGAGQFFSSATYATAPTLLKVLYGTAGAVTNGSLNSITYIFDGKVIVPPGYGISLLATTAADDTSGITMDLSWIELQH